MNVESILNKIQLFDELVHKSGFKSDLTDSFSAIQQGYNRNLSFLRAVSNKIKEHLRAAENHGLDNEMRYVLKDTQPFSIKGYLEELENLDSDLEITADLYFNNLYTILSSLNSKITENWNELYLIQGVMQKYANTKDTEKHEVGNALVSIIFKDLQSTGNLKDFTKSLNKWNRTLLIYHTLLKSDSPDEIPLVEIQNGSIDVVLNLNFDVAVDLASLFKVGLMSYGAYITYKSKLAKQIIETYAGNTKLIRLEKERENLLLDNIKDSIKNTALEQHKSRLKSDKQIDKAGVDKKADEISSVLTEHIIKGNEVKLLMPSVDLSHYDEDDLSEDEIQLLKAVDLSKNLRETSASAKEGYKSLSTEDKQLLLSRYTVKEDPNKEKDTPL